MSLAAIRALSRAEVGSPAVDEVPSIRGGAARDNRIAQLLQSLELQPAAKASELLLPTTDDEALSRVPTAEAAADLNSSLDVFLLAEQMAQRDDADATEVGAFVARIESRLPSRHGRSDPKVVPRREPPSAHQTASRPPPEARAPVAAPRAAPAYAPPAPASVPPAPASAPPASVPPAPSARMLQPSTRPSVAAKPRPPLPARSAASAPTANRQPPPPAPPRSGGGGAPVLASPSMELNMEEERLEASLARLDSALEAKRLNTAGSAVPACVGRPFPEADYGPRAESAPEGGSRLASRLRLATAACTTIESVPCKAHGLLPCSLCAAAAARPPRHPADTKRAARRPHAPAPLPVARPPAQRARSAGPPAHRVRSGGPTSYAALRVARDVHSARIASGGDDAGGGGAPSRPQQAEKPPVAATPPDEVQVGVPMAPPPVAAADELPPSVPSAPSAAHSETSATAVDPQYYAQQIQQQYLMAYQQHMQMQHQHQHHMQHLQHQPMQMYQQQHHQDSAGTQDARSVPNAVGGHIVIAAKARDLLEL